MTLNNILNVLESLSNKEGQTVTSVDSKDTEEALKKLVKFKRSLEFEKWPTTDYERGYFDALKQLRSELGLLNE